jgi:hypothetical protein
MNNKQRVHASLEGKPVDRYPVTASYNQLYYQDHFAELTGKPQWEMERWLYADPQEHLQVYLHMVELAPFEILQPQPAPTREERANTAFVIRADHPFRYDKQAHTYVSLGTESGHARDYAANEIQHVFDKADVKERVKITKADTLIASGTNDYIEATVAACGEFEFILSGGLVGTIYSCGLHTGQKRLFEMLIDQPALIDYLCQKITEQNIEIIHQLATAGGDAIYIDDATATSDMISVRHFERFSLPYMQEMVKEIHRVGHKAIVIYFGGIADRLDQIAAIGADGLMMETSMKGFINDIGATVHQIGHQVTLYSNIDPITVVQDGTDAALEAEIKRQIAAGRQGRGFILSTASPITPSTPLSRVQRFLELSYRLGAI